MKRLVPLIQLMIFSCCYGQQLQPPAAVRAGAYGTMQTHALQFTANQAALGNLSAFAAAVYGEKTFLLQELSVYQLAFAQPVGDGAFGLQIAYSGNTDFNRSKIGLAYGKNIGKKLALGVQFNYFNQQIRGYGRVAQVTAEVAALLHISDVFHAGFQVCNPAGVSLHKWIEKPPAIYTVGVTYQPSQSFSITAELVKAGRNPLEVQTGLAYRFAPALWAKAGINSSTAAFYIAAGFQLRDFAIEFVGSVHPHLGLSPGILVLYNDMEK